MTWSNVDQYIAKKLILSKENDIFKKILSRCQEHNLPDIQVTALQGKFLHLLIQLTQAKRVLEIGTLGGYSTLWMAKALSKDGYLLSLESHPLHHQVANKNILDARLDTTVELRLGNANEILPQLVEQKSQPFDFIFIDADKPSNPNYLKWSLKLSKPGSVIVCDNVVRNGELINMNNQNPGVSGIRDFFDLIADEPSLNATALQTVGEKGYDGFAIAVVNSV